MIVADKDQLLIISGNGEVIEPDGGVLRDRQRRQLRARRGARAPAETQYSADEIAYKALKIASEICVYTNDHITVEVV